MAKHHKKNKSHGKKWTAQTDTSQTTPVNSLDDGSQSPKQKRKEFSFDIQHDDEINLVANDRRKNFESKKEFAIRHNDETNSRGVFPQIENPPLPPAQPQVEDPAFPPVGPRVEDPPLPQVVLNGHDNLGGAGFDGALTPDQQLNQQIAVSAKGLVDGRIPTGSFAGNTGQSAGTLTEVPLPPYLQEKIDMWEIQQAAVGQPAPVTDWNARVQQAQNGIAAKFPIDQQLTTDVDLSDKVFTQFPSVDDSSLATSSVLKPIDVKDKQINGAGPMPVNNDDTSALASGAAPATDPNEPPLT